MRTPWSALTNALKTLGQSLRSTFFAGSAQANDAVIPILMAKYGEARLLISRTSSRNNFMVKD